MTEGYVLTLFKDTMTLGLTLAAPVLIVSLVIGLAVSIFQALTQVHEMTLTFVPKVAGVGLALVFLGSWMLQHLLEFTDTIFANLAMFAPQVWAIVGSYETTVLGNSVMLRNRKREGTRLSMRSKA